MGFSPGPPLALYTTHLYYLLMYFPSQTVRTFFVTSATDSHRAVLQSERMATLLMNCLFDNRQKERFLLHEFVIMPDHFHALITPYTERRSFSNSCSVRTAASEGACLPQRKAKTHATLRGLPGDADTRDGSPKRRCSASCLRDYFFCCAAGGCSLDGGTMFLMRM